MALRLALLAYAVILSRHKKSSRKPLRLAGRVASVESPLAPEGFVMVAGELWRARLREGRGVARERETVRVVGASGYLLEVEHEA